MFRKLAQSTSAACVNAILSIIVKLIVSSTLHYNKFVIKTRGSGAELIKSESVYK